ncbi:hypothetical protein [Sulfuriroseicoccus oceanibius]|uniref:Carbohydrate-binding domain-containing protein n=1 Tax=Sulfuriroseicoccus oceanibius TaxID=2707525 RepID=A0A6B3LDZ2_9BACT|nr:hypothetical protein [Sulfuriroseicoccus oceanibius]QQL45151.1 hypothetical protein G3M56_000760 [Sulfuriroseicoccus oceanibius]
MPDAPLSTLLIDRQPGALRPLVTDALGTDHPNADASYALTIEPTDAPSGRRLVFHFSAALPFEAAPGSTCGAFQAELWKHDCAEFFLVNPANGRYLEFNISPTGAWWAASFTAPRQQEAEQHFQNVDCSTTTLDEDKLWAIEFSLPATDIEAVLGAPLEALCGNVTAILQSPDQIFLTAARLGGTQPDFHVPESWLPVVVA